MKKLIPLVIAVWAVQGCEKAGTDVAISPAPSPLGKAAPSDKLRRMIREIKPELSNEKIGHFSSTKAFDLLLKNESLKPSLLEAASYTRQFGNEELDLVLKSEFDQDNGKESLQHEVFRMLTFATGSLQDGAKIAKQEEEELEKAKKLLSTPEVKARAEKLNGMLLKAVPELEAVRNPTGEKEWKELVARVLAPRSSIDKPDVIADTLKEAFLFEKDYGFHALRLACDKSLGPGQRKDEFGQEVPTARQLFNNLLGNLQRADYQKEHVGK